MVQGSLGSMKPYTRPLVGIITICFIGVGGVVALLLYFHLSREAVSYLHIQQILFLASGIAQLTLTLFSVLLCLLQVLSVIPNRIVNWLVALLAVCALGLAATALIWTNIRLGSLNKLNPSLLGLLAAGYVLCGLGIVSLMLYTVQLQQWKVMPQYRQADGFAQDMSQMAQRHSVYVFSADDGLQLSPSRSRRCSLDSARSHSFRSSTTRVGTSIRSKIRGRSTRSSIEAIPFPLYQAVSFPNDNLTMINHCNHHDHAGDGNFNGPSPLPTRVILPTIPGSRPDSPSTQGGFSSPPSAGLHSPYSRNRTMSNPAQMMVPSSTPPSSPPTSPPNFSRPTSKAEYRAGISGRLSEDIPISPEQYVQPRSQARALPQARPFSPILESQIKPTSNFSPILSQPQRQAASMTDLIHPLFRPDSPTPPQILTAGTMVTASPLASQPISPKTLSRIRSASAIQQRLRSGTPGYPQPLSIPGRNVVSDRSEKDICYSAFPRPPSMTVMKIAPVPASGRAAGHPRSKSQSSIYGHRGKKSEVSFVNHIPSSPPRTPPKKTGQTKEQLKLMHDLVTRSPGSPGPSVMNGQDHQRQKSAQMQQQFNEETTRHSIKSMQGDSIVLPDFVMTAGSRMSLTGYGKRKSVKRPSATLGEPVM